MASAAVDVILHPTGSAEECYGTDAPVATWTWRIAETTRKALRGHGLRAVLTRGEDEPEATIAPTVDTPLVTLTVGLSHGDVTGCRVLHPVDDEAAHLLAIAIAERVGSINADLPDAELPRHGKALPLPVERDGRPELAPRVPCVVVELVQANLYEEAMWLSGSGTDIVLGLRLAEAIARWDRETHEAAADDMASVLAAVEAVGAAGATAPAPDVASSLAPTPSEPLQGPPGPREPEAAPDAEDDMQCLVAVPRGGAKARMFRRCAWASAGLFSAAVGGSVYDPVLAKTLMTFALASVGIVSALSGWQMREHRLTDIESMRFGIQERKGG